MIESISNPEDVLREVLEAHGHQSPTQTQQYAVANGALDPGNKLLIADTGNGKTAVAEARLKLEIEQGGRVAYLVPTKQLTSAKAAEISEWADFNVLVAGRDNDAYKRGDVVVATFEGYYRMALQHHAKISDIDLAILDDFHYLYDPLGRGFTIEKLITSLKKENVSIFAMSASLGGASTIANWMNAKLIESPEPRRVPIQETVVQRVDGSSIRGQVARYIDENDGMAPFLVFNKSRKTAETAAKEIAQVRGWKPRDQSVSLSEFTSGTDVEPGTDRVAVTRVREELEDRVEVMTDEMEYLAQLISRGVAYHHAGLPSELKDYIEQLYQDGKLDALTLTTTLGSGFDAPVQTVIVADYKRWDSEQGSIKIGVWEYEQWIGRAGRSGYDHDVGHAVIFADSESDVQEYLAPRELEPVQSHVKEDELLRKFLLELVVTGHNSADEIRAYMDRTLWVHESEEEVLGVKYDPMDTVNEAAVWLDDNNFMQRMTNGFNSEPLGEAAVYYGFRQFGHYSLIGIRNLHDWMADQEEIGKFELINAICRHQEIKLYPSDESTVSDEFKELIVSRGFDSDSDYARTAEVIIRYWCENRSLETAAEHSGLRAEFTPSVARNISDVLGLIPEIADVAKDTEMPDWFEVFKLQVRYGVTADQAALVNLVDGVGRKRVRELDDWLDSHPRDLAGHGLMARLEDLHDQVGTDLLTTQLSDEAGPYGIGDELAGRIVEALGQERGI